MVGRTRVVSLDWDLGNTGRLTPCVNYEPVTLDGRTFSRTSISNMTRFDLLKLAPGTPIRIEIRGDVLAWVDRDGPDPEGAVPFAGPEGATFTTNEHGQRVFAYAAEATLQGRIERMMVKCGVKGVRIETITKLVEGGVVTDLAGMWAMDETRACSLPGLGESSALAVRDALDRKLQDHLWDWEILASVGINSVGRTLAKEALKKATLRELLDLTDPATPNEALASAVHAAIGPERARVLLDGVGRRRSDIEALMAVDPGFKATKAATSAYAGPFYKVVVTGDLKCWERDEFKTLIELMGHKMVGSISSKTDYLITNTPSSGTVKNKEAQAKGVPIITEEQAIEILGITAKPGERFNASRGMMEAPRIATLDEL
jgi:DNA ligase (NAD+)